MFRLRRRAQVTAQEICLLTHARALVALGWAAGEMTSSSNTPAAPSQPTRDECSLWESQFYPLLEVTEQFRAGREKR